MPANFLVLNDIPTQVKCHRLSSLCSVSITFVDIHVVLYMHVTFQVHCRNCDLISTYPSHLGIQHSSYHYSNNVYCTLYNCCLYSYR